MVRVLVQAEIREVRIERAQIVSLYQMDDALIAAIGGAPGEQQGQGG
jgi:hypothetical protein